jgi:hypothetical protein
MGTRADFYIGRGADAEWLGSIAWDGHPGSIPEHILRVDKTENFRAAVEQFIDLRDDGTKPADGWPWPWDDSRTTDYAYAFDDGKVWASSFGHAWFDPQGEEPDDDEGAKVATFPDMKERKNVTMGKRSGLLVFGI